MEDTYLIECIETETENSYFDFKSEIYDFDIPKNKEDFLTDILAFANGHSKGQKYIITGVKLHEDGNRTLNGITESKIKDGADYQSLINDNIEPNIIVDFKLVDYKNKKFGIFRINEENRDKPYLLSKQYGKLPKGFIRIRKGQKNEYVVRRDFDLFYHEKKSNETSNIHVKGIINGFPNDRFVVNKFKNMINEEKAQEEISNLYAEIKQLKLIKSDNSAKFGSPLTINDCDIQNIRNYAEKNNITLPVDFFDIGNITYINIVDGCTSFFGSDTEKQKYSLLCKFGDLTEAFKSYIDFYNKTNKIFYTELAIENSGKKFDEDIEVTLKIKKEKFLDFGDFPVPSEAIIKNILNKEILSEILKFKKNHGINTYTAKYPNVPPRYPTSTPTLYGCSCLDREGYVEYYKEYIKTIADYEITFDSDYYFIKFEQKEIKPNEVIFIPSRLLFKEKPDYIDYELRTKHNPNIQKGKITLQCEDL